MAPEREERLLMRQRGAATRQIKNTGFDLLIPSQQNASLQPRKSEGLRKTPQPELLPQKSTGRSRKTPRRSPRGTPATGATNKRGRAVEAAIQEANEDEELAVYHATQDDGEGITLKKRKLEKPARTANPFRYAADSIAPEVQIIDSQPIQDPNAPSSGGVKKRKKRKSIGQQSMKSKRRKIDSPGQPARRLQSVAKSKSAPPTDPLDLPDQGVRQEEETALWSADAVQEFQSADLGRPLGIGVVDEEPDSKVKKRKLEQSKGKKKRKSVVAQPKKRAKPTTAKENRIQKDQNGKLVANLARQKLQRVNEDVDDLPEPTGGMVEDQGSSSNTVEEQSKPNAKRKKRKSIGQQRRSKMLVPLGAPAKPAIKAGPAVKEPGRTKVRRAGTITTSRAAATKTSQQSDLADEGIRSDIDEVKPKISPPKKSGGWSRRSTKVAAPQPPESTKTAKAPRSRTQPSQNPSESRVPPENSIPITIYTPPSSDSPVFDDPLTTTVPHALPTRPINAVDVLSQICREMIAKTVLSLAAKASNEADRNRQSECKRKKQTVTMYGEELGQRLMQLTRAVNENAKLNGRVREAKKEERELRKDIKGSEEERVRVKERKEEVLKERKKRELEDLLGDIAGAVKRGWDLQAKERDVSVEL